jgi:hypothetical protein
MRRNIAFPTTLITLSMFVLNCCELYAADVLDQSNVVAPGTTSIDSLLVGETGASGQAVRAGITGILSRVELGVFRNHDVASPIMVDIVRTQNGQPSFAAGDRLATRTITQGQIPLLTSFAQFNAPAYTVSVDFSASGLTFNNGDLFGIVLRSNAREFFDYSWWVAHFPVNTYPAGASFSFQYATSLVLPHGGIDTQFATYVLVPEPSALLLLGIGAISLLGYRKAKSHG